MAGLELELYDINMRCIAPDGIVSLELSQDMEAACDGLRLTLVHNEILSEIYRVVLSRDGRRLFNGYVDTQREMMGENGYECFIYARSSACLLTDRACRPTTYYMPSIDALFRSNASDIGIRNGLENIYTTGQYQVGSGVSCYGAINEFVYALTGSRIMLTPYDEMVLIRPDERVEISADRIISTRRIINRAQAVSRVDYKVSADTDYKYHAKSRLLERNKITNSLVKNVSSYPEWQRERLIENTLEQANSRYYCLELCVDGITDITLRSIVRANGELSGGYDWRVRSVNLRMNDKGFTTRLELFREYDLEEIIYVD